MGFPICEKCGKPVEKLSRKEAYGSGSEITERCHEPQPDEMKDSFIYLCDDCRDTKHEFTMGRAAFVYDNVMRKCMSALKYGGRREYGETLGLLLYERFAELLRSWKPDGIVAVPVHPDRLKKRGYDQAYVIAEAVSKRSGIPVMKDVVIRTKNTRAMKVLGAGERRKNMEEAFAPGKSEVYIKKVLIIDDIYTTGSTMDAVSRVLKARGCKDIRFLTVCIGHGFMLQ